VETNGTTSPEPWLVDLDECGRVWVYPLATKYNDVVRIGQQLAPAALQSGFNASTRLTVIMMGR